MSKDKKNSVGSEHVESAAENTVEPVADETPVVQEKKTTALVGGGDYGDYSGQGFENTSKEDFSIAFLNLLQGLSDQVNGEGALEGAKAGMLYNTVTQDLFDGKKGLVLIPAHREQVHVEWIPRDDGGGYVGRHELGAEIATRAAENKNEKGVPVDPETNHEIIQTAYIYGIIVHEDGRHEPIVISFSSTKLKVYRHLMTKLNQFTTLVGSGDDARKVIPPIFAHRLRIATKGEKNKKGAFFNFTIGADGASLQDSLLATNSDEFVAALKFRKLVQEGTAQANYDSVAGEGGGGVGDDEVPF